MTQRSSFHFLYSLVAQVHRRADARLWRSLWERPGAPLTVHCRVSYHSLNHMNTNTEPVVSSCLRCHSSRLLLVWVSSLVRWSCGFWPPHHGSDCWCHPLEDETQEVGKTPRRPAAARSFFHTLTSNSFNSSLCLRHVDFCIYRNNVLFTFSHFICLFIAFCFPVT